MANVEHVTNVVKKTFQESYEWAYISAVVRAAGRACMVAGGGVTAPSPSCQSLAPMPHSLIGRLGAVQAWVGVAATTQGSYDTM